MKDKIEDYRGRLEGIRSCMDDCPCTDNLLSLVAEIAIDILEAQTKSVGIKRVFSSLWPFKEGEHVEK